MSGPRPGTRERILAATVELVADQGFSGTTVEEIAERAGVAKGTVFYNFGSKERLFHQVLQDGVARLTERFAGAVTGLHGLAAVAALVRAELEAVSLSPAFAQIFVAELFRTARPWQDVLQEVRSQSLVVLRSVIVDGRDRGDFPSTVEADQAASAVLASVLVLALDWLAYAPHRSADDVHAEIMGMVRGLLLDR